MILVSTHNTTLRTRLIDHLQDRGFDPQPAGRVDRYTAQTAPDNFLNHLFDFPVLDTAFLRYETEMVAIDEGLSVFGTCASGLFCLDQQGAVVLLDGEENREVIAATTAEFCALFHRFVSVSTGSPKGYDFGSEEPLRSAAADSPFWGYILHALEEGDAAPNRHLLAYLVDGEIESIA